MYVLPHLKVLWFLFLFPSLCLVLLLILCFRLLLSTEKDTFLEDLLPSLPNSFSPDKSSLLWGLKRSTSLETSFAPSWSSRDSLTSVQLSTLLVVETSTTVLLPASSGVLSEECCPTRLPVELLLWNVLRSLKEFLRLSPPRSAWSFLLLWECFAWSQVALSALLEDSPRNSDGSIKALLLAWKRSVKFFLLLTTQSKRVLLNKLERLWSLRLSKLLLSLPSSLNLAIK